MEEITFGEVIRGIRKAKGMTQEAVAEGICSPSSLSKMENDSQVPSRQKFRQIMERLGESGYSYAHFFSVKDREKERIRRELMQNLEFERMNRAEELLFQARERVSEADRTEWQFWKTGELIWRQMYGQDPEGYTQQCVKLFELTRSWPGKETQLWEQCFTGVEMLLMNNAALGYFWTGNCREAIGIFLRLHGMLRRDRQKISDYGKKKAVLCANLCICFAALGQMQEAWRFHDSAIRCVREQGGVFLYLKLLRVRLNLYGRQEDADELYRNKILIYRILADVWGRTEAQRRMEHLLEQPLGIMIL